MYESIELEISITIHINIYHKRGVSLSTIQSILSFNPCPDLAEHLYIAQSLSLSLDNPSTSLNYF